MSEDIPRVIGSNHLAVSKKAVWDKRHTTVCPVVQCKVHLLFTSQPTLILWRVPSAACSDFITQSHRFQTQSPSLQL